METAQALTKARRTLWYALRCNLCERLISWSLIVAPEGYVPSHVEACLDAFRHEGKFNNIKLPAEK